MGNSLVSCILGFMVVTQYKMTQDNIEENIRLQRAGDLAVQLREAQSERGCFIEANRKRLNKMVLLQTLKLMNSS